MIPSVGPDYPGLPISLPSCMLFAFLCARISPLPSNDLHTGYGLAYQTPQGWVEAGEGTNHLFIYLLTHFLENIKEKTYCHYEGCEGGVEDMESPGSLSHPLLSPSLPTLALKGFNDKCDDDCDVHILCLFTKYFFLQCPLQCLFQHKLCQTILPGLE